MLTTDVTVSLAFNGPSKGLEFLQAGEKGLAVKVFYTLYLLMNGVRILDVIN